ncbi:MAG: toxin-antitoxin system HicB family antitoxin [Gammaproteobacteria bacterium]|nr:toxin-antitoxin system HicB family antitoxin [Gammaproteobacteria bacterium]
MHKRRSGFATPTGTFAECGTLLKHEGGVTNTAPQSSALSGIRQPGKVESCEKAGRESNKPFSGEFAVRVEFG